MPKKTPSHSKKLSAKKIFIPILLTIGIIIVTVAISNAVCLNFNVKKAKSFPASGCPDLSAENISDGTWNIYSDDGLKVLQLTDIHLGGGWLSFRKDAMAMNAVASVISAEKPDFVVVTGDIAYAIPIYSGTLNNKSGARIFAELMETLGVYWTASYGNHDVESYNYLNREKISEFYSQYPHCLVRDGAKNTDGSANQVFHIVNSDGNVIRSLYTVDSHSFVDGDFLGFMWKYDNIHENQIKWYSDSVKKTNEENRDYTDSVPSTVFTHVPLSEYRTAWFEYVNNGFADTEDVSYFYGTAGETGITVYSGVYEDQFFETMLELGSTDSVFCGHDHKNNFSLGYKGIRLSYSYVIDYLAYDEIYKKGDQRGCTVIEIDSDGAVDFSLQNFYQDKYVTFYPKEEVTFEFNGT